MDYNKVHQQKLVQLRKGGARCQVTSGASVIDGYCTQMQPAVNEYAALGLDTKQNIKLLWLPVVRGQVPSKGATFTYSGTKYAVAEPNPYDPDGNGALYCELIGSR